MGSYRTFGLYENIAICEGKRLWDSCPSFLNYSNGKPCLVLKKLLTQTLSSVLSLSQSGSTKMLYMNIKLLPEVPLFPGPCSSLLQLHPVLQGKSSGRRHSIPWLPRQAGTGARLRTVPTRLGPPAPCLKARRMVCGNGARRKLHGAGFPDENLFILMVFTLWESSLIILVPAWKRHWQLKHRLFQGSRIWDILWKQEEHVFWNAPSCLLSIVTPSHSCLLRTGL